MTHEQVAPKTKLAVVRELAHEHRGLVSGLAVVLLVALGSAAMSRPKPLAETQATPAPVVTQVKMEWSSNGTDRAAMRDSALGHIGRQDHAPLGRTITAYEMHAILLGSAGYRDDEETISWCRFNVPIVEYDWDIPTPDDGCNGCEGNLGELIGYKDYCGPFRYYEEADCQRAVFEVGLHWLQFQHPDVTSYKISDGSVSDKGERLKRNGVRFVCRPVKTDEYPISWGEERNWRAMKDWPWYKGLDPVHKD